MDQTCSICASGTEFLATARILQKYDVRYFRCLSCGFVQTEKPFWLAEAYGTAISGSDVGLVQRNLHLAQVAKVVIPLFCATDGCFVDYAGGYGLFVRLMRDSGIDFRWHDEFCENIFAKGFEGQVGSRRYELATAFEVFEHFADPLKEIARMLTLSESILFTTQLLPEPPPSPEKWWFYGIEHGQHVSFYTRASLRVIGEMFDKRLYSNGKSMHLLTSKRVSRPMFSLLSHYKVARLVAPFIRRRSLLPSDYSVVTGGDLPGIRKG